MPEVPAPDPRLGASLKVPHWKHQQKILWGKVRKQNGRSKYRLKIRDLFADERCSPAILGSLLATDVSGWDAGWGWIGLK